MNHHLLQHNILLFTSICSPLKETQGLLMIYLIPCIASLQKNPTFINNCLMKLHVKMTVEFQTFGWILKMQMLKILTIVFIFTHSAQ